MCPTAQSQWADYPRSNAGEEGGVKTTLTLQALVSEELTSYAGVESTPSSLWEHRRGHGSHHRHSTGSIQTAAADVASVAFTPALPRAMTPAMCNALAVLHTDIATTRVRIGPDFDEPAADSLFAEVVQVDSELLPIRELSLLSHRRISRPPLGQERLPLASLRILLQ